MLQRYALCRNIGINTFVLFVYILLYLHYIAIIAVLLSIYNHIQLF